MKKTIILHPLFLAIIPILALFEHNQEIASSYYLIYPLLIATVFIIIFFFTIYFFIKNKIKAGIISSLFISAFFMFDNFSKLFQNFEDIIPADKLYYKNIALFVYLILFIYLFYIIHRSKKNFATINTLLNVFAIIVISMQIFNISSYQLKSHANETYLSVEKNNQKHSEDLPDIYYIILDGYGRQDILQDLYDYDNSDFINYLESKDFYIASKATSNYNKTLFSIPSSLNMDYVYSIRKKLNNYASDERFFRTIIKENLVSNILEENDYTFVTLPYTWFGNYKNLKSDIHLSDEPEQNSFNAILINETPLYLLASQLEMKLNQKKTLELLDKLPEIAKIPETTFSYVHIMASHPPFLFDENGPVAEKEINCLSGGDGNDYFKTCPGVEKFKKDLTSQVTFFNEQFKVIIEEILNNSDKDPIIIIQGDHGPGSALNQDSLEDSNIFERMSILNAYHVPEEIKKELYPEISPVNSFRIILNHLLNYDFEILADENYFIVNGLGENMANITEELKKP